ncbi:GntR family transcriptional regulator [Bifidobacterium biavatii]|uniref:HTH gntR-type domain-containing protein n=1 Tax=Bifidobacterium biavatii DSM 23969 TaxID=1437608 RepID=A0A087A1T3_9BIFI|nr:GntR family transcriptional regulator [Bifidobacterium biavatii]KFI52733.1 hypothetical protein BBIA_0417 [Bifidobacterium biavatii DSM 23969]
MAGVRRISLVDQLVATIQQELITGQYAAGTPFIEEEVKKRYEVSRSTTREALARLEEDGYLTRDPATRTLRFRTPAADEIEQVYFARRFYEGAGINNAKHASPQQLEAIRESSQQLVAVLEDGKPLEVVEAEWRCHTAIVECIGSPLITAQYRQLLRRLSLALAQIESPQEDAAAGQDHMSIAKLILAKQYRDAKKLLFDHLASGEKELLAQAS